MRWLSAENSGEEMIGPFEKELASLLNKYCKDNTTGTPDFILAAYLTDCLATYRRIKEWDAMWRSRLGVPLAMQDDGPPMER